MANQQAIDQITRSISFEVEAIPQDNTIQLTSTANTTPLNVKIKVRKKHNAGAAQNAVISIPKLDKPGAAPERIRLVSSDQTIMSFNVFMENEENEKAPRKAKKGFFGFFKSGARTDVDDEGRSKSPTSKKMQGSASRSADEMYDPSMHSENTSYNDSSHAEQKASKKGILGKCKPGGCLDPPFSEDKYAYAKKKRASPVQSVPLTALYDENLKIVGETPSMYKTKLHVKKKKSNTDDVVAMDKEFNVNTKSSSHASLTQEENYKVTEIFSNSLITYPPAVTVSEQKIHDRVNEKNIKNRTSSAENNYRSSVQSSADIYYCPSDRKNSTRSNNEKNKQDHTIGAVALLNQPISTGDDKLLTTKTTTKFETSYMATQSSTIQLKLEGKPLLPPKSLTQVKEYCKSSFKELVTQSSTTPVSDGHRYLDTARDEHRGFKNECNVTPQISTLNGHEIYTTINADAVNNANQYPAKNSKFSLTSTEMAVESYIIEEVSKEVSLKLTMKNRPSLLDESRSILNEIDTKMTAKVARSPSNISASSQTNWAEENLFSLRIASKTSVKSKPTLIDNRKLIPNRLIVKPSKVSIESSATIQTTIADDSKTILNEVIPRIPITKAVSSELETKNYPIIGHAKGTTIQNKKLGEINKSVSSKTSTKREPVHHDDGDLISNELTTRSYTATENTYRLSLKNINSHANSSESIVGGLNAKDPIILREISTKIEPSYADNIKSLQNEMIVNTFMPIDTELKTSATIRTDVNKSNQNNLNEESVIVKEVLKELFTKSQLECTVDKKRVTNKKASESPTTRRLSSKTAVKSQPFFESMQNNLTVKPSLSKISIKSYPKNQPSYTDTNHELLDKIQAEIVLTERVSSSSYSKGKVNNGDEKKKKSSGVTARITPTIGDLQNSSSKSKHSYADAIGLVTNELTVEIPVKKDVLLKNTPRNSITSEFSLDGLAPKACQDKMDIEAVDVNKVPLKSSSIRPISESKPNELIAETLVSSQLSAKSEHSFSSDNEVITKRISLDIPSNIDIKKTIPNKITANIPVSEDNFMKSSAKSKLSYVDDKELVKNELHTRTKIVSSNSSVKSKFSYVYGSRTIEIQTHTTGEISINTSAKSKPSYDVAKEVNSEKRYREFNLTIENPIKDGQKSPTQTPAKIKPRYSDESESIPNELTAKTPIFSIESTSKRKHTDSGENWVIPNDITAEIPPTKEVLSNISVKIKPSMADKTATKPVNQKLFVNSSTKNIHSNVDDHELISNELNTKTQIVYSNVSEKCKETNLDETGTIETEIIEVPFTKEFSSKTCVKDKPYTEKEEAVLGGLSAGIHKNKEDIETVKYETKIITKASAEIISSNTDGSVSTPNKLVVTTPTVLSKSKSKFTYANDNDTITNGIPENPVPSRVSSNISRKSKFSYTDKSKSILMKENLTDNEVSSKLSAKTHSMYASESMSNKLCAKSPLEQKETSVKIQLNRTDDTETTQNNRIRSPSEVLLKTLERQPSYVNDNKSMESSTKPSLKSQPSYSNEKNPLLNEILSNKEANNIITFISDEEINPGNGMVLKTVKAENLVSSRIFANVQPIYSDNSNSFLNELTTKSHSASNSKQYLTLNDDNINDDDREIPNEMTATVKTTIAQEALPKILAKGVPYDADDGTIKTTKIHLIEEKYDTDKLMKISSVKSQHSDKSKTVSLIDNSESNQKDSIMPTPLREVLTKDTFKIKTNSTLTSAIIEPSYIDDNYSVLNKQTAQTNPLASPKSLFSDTDAKIPSTRDIPSKLSKRSKGSEVIPTELNVNTPETFLVASKSSSVSDSNAFSIEMTVEGSLSKMSAESKRHYDEESKMESRGLSPKKSAKSRNKASIKVDGTKDANKVSSKSSVKRAFSYADARESIQKKLIALVSSKRKFSYADDDRKSKPDKLTAAKTHLTTNDDKDADKNLPKVQNEISYLDASISTANKLVVKIPQSRELFSFDLSVERTLEGKNDLQKRRSRSTPSLRSREIIDSDRIQENQAYASSDIDIEDSQTYKTDKEIKEQNTYKESTAPILAQPYLFESYFEPSLTIPESKPIQDSIKPAVNKYLAPGLESGIFKDKLASAPNLLEPNINLSQLKSVDDGFDEPTALGEISELEHDDLETSRTLFCASDKITPELESIARDQLKQEYNAVIADHSLIAVHTDSDNTLSQFKVKSEAESYKSRYADTSLKQFPVDSNYKKDRESLGPNIRTISLRNQEENRETEQKRAYDIGKIKPQMLESNLNNNFNYHTDTIKNFEDHHTSKDISRLLLLDQGEINESSPKQEHLLTAAKEFYQTALIDDKFTRKNMLSSIKVSAPFADQTNRKDILEFHESKDFETLLSHSQPVLETNRESLKYLRSPNSYIVNANRSLDQSSTMSINDKDMKIQPKTLSTGETLDFENKTKQEDYKENILRKTSIVSITSSGKSENSKQITPFETFENIPERYEYQISDGNYQDTSKRFSKQSTVKIGQVTPLQNPKDNFLSSVRIPSALTTHTPVNNLLFKSEYKKISKEKDDNSLLPLESKKRISQSYTSSGAPSVHSHRSEDLQKVYERKDNKRLKTRSRINKSDSKVRLSDTKMEPDQESNRILETQQQNYITPISYYNNSIPNEANEALSLGETKREHLETLDQKIMESQEEKILDFTDKRNQGFVGEDVANYKEEATPSEMANEYRSKYSPSASLPSVRTSRQSETEKVASKSGVVVLDVAFQSYLNSRNERVIKSFEPTEPPKRYQDDAISCFRTTLQASDAPVKITVDSSTDLSMSLSRRDLLLRESKEKYNMISNMKMQTQINKAIADVNPGHRLSTATNSDNNLQRVLSTVYNSHMVPLQDIIKHLKDDIDALATQQEMFRQKIMVSKKPRPVRISHTVKRCGCLRK